jgi:hypothetical protein
MPKINVTISDILSGAKLQPDWYKATVKSVAAGPGKKDATSTVYTIELVIAEGPHKNVPVRTWLSEKMMPRIVQFIECFVPKVEAGKDYELEETVGKQVKIFASYNDVQNANEVKDFRSVNL